MKNGLFLVMLMAFLFAGCGLIPDSVTDPAQEMSFYVTVNVNSKISAKYRLVDVFMMDAATQQPQAKIGRSEGPFGTESDKFRITVPESYRLYDRKLTYNVEFELKNSGFDKLDALNNLSNVDDVDIGPMIKSLLKSKHWAMSDLLPWPGENKELPLIDALEFGYSPGSYQLSDFEGIPLIYFLDITETQAVKSMGFVLKMVAATAASETTPTTPIGAAIEDLDWAMIMKEGYLPGTPFKLWFIYEQPETGHACPCVNASPPITCTTSDCVYSYSSYTIPDYKLNKPYPVDVLINDTNVHKNGWVVPVPTIDESRFTSCGPPCLP